MLAQDAAGADERSTRVVGTVVDLLVMGVTNGIDTTNVVSAHAVAVTIEVYGEYGVRVDGERVVETRPAYTTIVDEGGVVKVVPVVHCRPPLVRHRVADGGHLISRSYFLFLSDTFFALAKKSD